ncbi:hypothetical protein HDV04_004315 [Boothiomyces sp. JEL0838]|nr:hypothetical protein HDV04_004315 [Boothiomyces sp. JEL0838]
MSFVLDEIITLREQYLKLGGTDWKILQEISNLEKEIKSGNSGIKSKIVKSIDDIKLQHEKEMIQLENIREKSILQYELNQLEDKHIGFTIEFIFLSYLSDETKIKLSFCLFEAGSALNKVKCEESVEKRNNSFIFGKRKAYISIDSSRKVYVIADFRKTKQCWEDSKIGWATFPIFNNEGEINYGQWKLPLNCYPINFEYSAQNGTLPDYNKFIFFRIYPNYTLNTEQLISITLDDSTLTLFSTFKEAKKAQNEVEQPKVVQPTIVDILPDVGKTNTVNIKKKSTLVKQEVPKTNEKSIVGDKKDSQKLDDLNQTKKDMVKQFPIGFQFVEINNLQLVENPTIFLRVKLSEGDSAKPLFETKPCEAGVIENQYGWEFNFYIETFVERSGRKAVLEIVVDYALNYRRVLASGQFEIFKYHFKEPFDVNDGNQSITFDGEIIGKPTLLLKIYKPKFGRPIPKKFVPKLIVPSFPEEAYFYRPVESSDKTDNELSSIYISIDAGRFLPDNSTASRILGSFYNVRTKSFSKKIQIATKIDLDTSVYNPDVRVPCTSVLVRVTSSEVEAPPYSSKVYQTYDYEKPQESDLNLYYFVYAQKKSFSVRDRLLAMGNLPKSATQTEESLLAWTTKLFEATNEIPRSIDLAFICKYDATYGFKTSIDKAENLESKGFTIAVISFSTSPFKRGAPLKTKYPNDILYTKITNLNSEYKNPEFDDGYFVFWFRQRPFNTDMWVIFELYSVLNDEISRVGWTACPIFHPQKYVRMGRFKLPLFEGDMDVETLSQYSSFEDSWGEEGELTLTNTFSSITIRIVDGRHDIQLLSWHSVQQIQKGWLFKFSEVSDTTCIVAKQKWIIAMDIVLASRNHLHASFIPEDEEYLKVVMETPEESTKDFPDLSSYDNSIYNMEKNLHKSAMLLSRLLWRYELSELAGYCQLYSRIDWRAISFTNLRNNLIGYFSKKTKIDYRFHGFPQKNLEPTFKFHTTAGSNHRIPLSSTSGSPFTPLIHGSFKDISTKMQEKHADRYLDNLVEYLEEFGDQTTVDGFDVLYSSGVMTLKLGAKGTYVLNKQPPNKQIWLSSPISGPKRFDLNGLKTKWVYSRTGISLNSLLDEELTQLLESKIKTPE